MNPNEKRINIVVTDHDFSVKSFNTEKEMLKPYIESGDINFKIYNCKEVNELYNLASDADIFVNQYLNLTKKDMERFKRLKLIVKYTMGYDNIDIKGATDLGILVCHNAYGKEEVADHALALMLSSIRKVFQANELVRNGKWLKGIPYRKFLPQIPCIQDMVLGVIGAGRIGRQVTRKGKEFFKHVYCYDPFVNTELIEEVGGEKVKDLDFLLNNSDVITLHSLLTPETYHCINENTINKMKDGAILINVGRGALVNTNALVNALIDGKIAMAALDTIEEEPLSANHILNKIENVILTPHIGGCSEYTILDSKIKALDKVIQYLKGELPDNAVNATVFKKYS